MGLIDKLASVLVMDDPSSYEDYYDDVSWKTFRVDESIWERLAYKRPGIAYFRKLQVCYMQILEEMGESFLYDVGGIREKFNELHLRNCDLEKQLAIAEGKNQILQSQLESALKWQTVQGRKNEVFEANGIELVKASSNQPKEGARFANNSGTSLIDNHMLASAYYENDWDLNEISDELGISAGTAKSYISTMQKHYKVQYIQGAKYICFDSDYGNIQWNLALYAKLSTKFPQVAANS